MEDPLTGEIITVQVNEVPDPDNPDNPPIQTLVINGVPSVSFDPSTGTAVIDDPRNPGNPIQVTIPPNNQGILLPDGSPLVERIDTNECGTPADTCVADGTDALPMMCANKPGTFSCNCHVEDDPEDCREYFTNADLELADATPANAKQACYAQGGRLMRITTTADLAVLTGLDAAKFSNHRVCAGDSNLENQWLSYDSPVSRDAFTLTGKDGGDGEDCASLMFDADAGQYRLEDVNCNDAAPFVCEKLKQTVDGSCNHWTCSNLQPTMVDQEPNESDVIGLTKSDGRKYSGTLDGTLITVPGAGLMGQPWFGNIDKTDPENCLHEKLDEYCRNLGLVDGEIVKGEREDCTGRNYARKSGKVLLFIMVAHL